MSRIQILPATLRDASYVMANLRPADEAEIMCQVPEGTRRHDMAGGLLYGGDCFVARIDDRPVAIFGSSPINVAAVSFWAMGTKHMRRSVPAITAYVRDVHAPDLVRRGYWIAEARSHVEHHEAHRWMVSTGAVRVDPPFVFGRNGEKFLIFRWTKDVLDPKTGTTGRLAHG